MRLRFESTAACVIPSDPAISDDENPRANRSLMACSSSSVHLCLSILAIDFLSIRRRQQQAAAYDEGN